MIKIKQNKANRGFTLIELLVVIAIIGLLSAVVVGSLSSARNKSKDSSIKAQLNQIRPQAAFWFDSNRTYVNMFVVGTGDAKLIKIYDTAVKTSGARGANGSTATNWYAEVKLPSANQYWCIDSNSFAGLVGTVGLTVPPDFTATMKCN